MLAIRHQTRVEDEEALQQDGNAKGEPDMLRVGYLSDHKESKGLGPFWLTLEMRHGPERPRSGCQIAFRQLSISSFDRYRLSVLVIEMVNMVNTAIPNHLQLVNSSCRELGRAGARHCQPAG